MNVLDLFSGIGGFSLGLERAGMRTVAFCEIEPFCRAVLRKHWPNVPIYEDVRTLTAERLAADGIAVDVICGGFPCQDVSNSGRKAGIDGERSGLWREIVRLVRELSPQCVLVENVPGLLGRGMGTVVGDLAALGYDAEWRCLSASALGAQHKRERVFIVAHPSSVGQSKPWFDWEDGIGKQPGFAWETTDALDAIRRGTVPALCREAHGVFRRMDRLTALGNAITPQQAEVIGRYVMRNLT